MFLFPCESVSSTEALQQTRQIMSGNPFIGVSAVSVCGLLDRVKPDRPYQAQYSVIQSALAFSLASFRTHANYYPPYTAPGISGYGSSCSLGRTQHFLHRQSLFICVSRSTFYKALAWFRFSLVCVWSQQMTFELASADLLDWSFTPIVKADL